VAESDADESMLKKTDERRITAMDQGHSLEIHSWMFPGWIFLAQD
jgi:hypothetical protein